METGKAFHITITACVSALLALGLLGCGGNGNSTQQTDSDSKTDASRTTATAASSSSSSANPGLTAGTGQPDPQPPGEPVRLVFIHHSVGEDWLDDSKGELGAELKKNNYFVSDTNYGWGPSDIDTGSDNIGDHTDFGHWYNWFAGPNRETYLSALYREAGQQTGSPYARLAANPDPGGENEVIVIKSCFTNYSALAGNPSDRPTSGSNPLRGQDGSSEYQTVANIKGIYNDMLGYFASRPDKLFVVVTAPPLSESETSAAQAASARALSRWLTEEWLRGYPQRNVAVFDFYNVLTSNGGGPEKSDYSAYAIAGDSHPTAAGLQKASVEFAGLLNSAYNWWQQTSGQN